MNNLWINRLKASLALLALVGLASCGGGGASTPSTGAAYRGQFVDSNVAGLDWQTATRSGTTDTNGYFEYDTQGETVTFSINNVQLGTVNADQSVHVFDLEQSQYDQSSNKGARIAQLLQTLDSDSDATNGIQLTPEVKAKFASTITIDFHAEPAAWDTKMATVASNVGKPVVPMDVAYAHASSNMNTSASCAIPVKNYIIAGTSGAFSSESLNCSQRANLEAFVYDMSPFMFQQEQIYYDLINSKYSDENTDEFVKMTLQKNAAKAGLTLVVDFMKLKELDDGTVLELSAGSTTLANDLLGVLCLGISCDAAKSEKGLKVLTLAVDVTAKTHSCIAKNWGECGNAIRTLLESPITAEQLGRQLTTNEVKQIVEIMTAWAESVADLAKVKGVTLQAAMFNFTGSFLEAAIKTGKALSGSDGKVFTTTMDTMAEGLNVFMTCAGALYGPNQVECLDRGGNYVHDKILTSFMYIGLTWQLSGILQSANEYKIARLVLAEKYKYGSLAAAMAANGINVNIDYSRSQWRSADDLLINKLALANDALPFFNQAGFFDNVLDHIRFNQDSVSVYAARYADGSYGSCRNVTVTSPIPDGIVAPPYLANPGQNLTYTSSSTGSVSQFVFNWGDGTYTYSDLPAAQHVFDKAGYYIVTISPIVKKAFTNEEAQTCKTVGTSGISVAAQQVTGVSPAAASVGVPVTISVTGTNLPLTSVLAMADAICETPTNRTSTGFNEVCTPQGTTGSKVITVKTDIQANGGTVIDSSFVVTVTAAPASTSTLNDTGISASQCYQAGSDVLVACNSAGALALNNAQDGMLGRDVTASNSADGKLGFSFTAVSGGCVQDNNTGLMWEIKTTDGGLRDGTNIYTNYDSTTSAQKWDGVSAYINPTQADIDAATNTVGYVAAVNASNLCGHSDWRLPIADELQSIVDYSVASPGPYIDTTWFPDTQGSLFWPSSPYAGNSNDAWIVSFYDGLVFNGYRTGPRHVRLVRASGGPSVGPGGGGSAGGGT